MPSTVQYTGAAAGGGINIEFTCTGCSSRKVNFRSSSLLQGSNRASVGTRLALAFLTTGHTYAEYRKTLGEHFGLRCYSQNPYHELIKTCQPHVSDILDSMMNTAKESCRQKAPHEIGSSARMCVTSDGMWMTRGHFSKNGTFVIIDYMTQGLLWRGHLSQKGARDEHLYAGTSKSMEANLALVLFGQAEQEGFNIEIVWQDDDSSSAIAVKEVFPTANVMKCGGHIGRAAHNRLTSFASVKSFSPQMKALYRRKFPEVSNANGHIFSGKFRFYLLPFLNHVYFQGKFCELYNFCLTAKKI